MWVDLFPQNGSLPPIVDVTPRHPVPYEIRVIIYTAELYHSEEKYPDIFVKVEEESMNVKG